MVLVNSIWPEEKAKAICFYVPKDTSSSSSTNEGENDHRYNLTIVKNDSINNNNNMNDDNDNDIRKNNDNDISKNNSNSNSNSNQLMLYNAQTKQVVDCMNTHDIIGVELEISFLSSENGEHDFSRNVGFNHAQAEERANKMAQYENEIGKKLIGGAIDDYLVKDENMKENAVDNDNDDDDDDGTNVDNAKSKDASKDKESSSSSTNNSSAYLNIYCYPKSLPRPGLLTRIKNCVYPTSSISSKKMNLDDVIAQKVNNEGESKNFEGNTMDESQLGHRYEKHRRYKLYPCEDFSNVRELIQAIKVISNLDRLLEEPMSTSNNNNKDDDNQVVENSIIIKNSRPTYFVIVNPMSGTKQASKIYETKMTKMLQEAGIDHDVLVTQYSGHAKERMAKIEPSVEENHCDVTDYDAIISMGGDGLLSEIINGLMARSDFDTIMKKLKFGIVGCGTCNGLVASLLHAVNEKFDVLESIFLVCKGKTSKIDLSQYQTKNKTYTAFLTMSWAIIADCDIESEFIRFLGVLRNDIWGAWRVINLRTYKAKFSYLPAKETHSNTIDTSISYECPNLSDEVPSDWVTIEDDFILFWASQVTHASHNIFQSPTSKLDDGLFRIWIVRKPCSRLALAGMLIQMETGHHANYKNSEFYDCHAFRLEPLSTGSFNDVDGEVVEAGTIQASVTPSVLNIFS